MVLTMLKSAVTGRIDTIAPYFPFSKGEQAVVAHKFLLAMQIDAQLPIKVES
ncbi:hypothetical protein F4776DRAFT_644314 [Hypoxylon sp. NC0597]|nr:hypothetical protein F4776DRAFT_644314 [Hypoxylon sp. NC0597]